MKDDRDGIDSKEEIEEINLDIPDNEREEKIENIDLDSIDLTAYSDKEKPDEEDAESADDNDEHEKEDEDFGEVTGKLKGALPYLLGGVLTVALIIVIICAIGVFSEKKRASENETGAVSASVNDISTSAQPSGNDLVYIYVSGNDGETIVYTSEYAESDTSHKTSETQTSSESLNVAETTSSLGSISMLNKEFLDSDDYPEITSLIEDYFTAYASCNLGQLLSLVDYNGGTQITQEEMDERAEIVEAYQDLEFYIIEGMDVDSYVVYASYGIKFYNIDTAAPTLTRFYVVTSDNGSYYIYNGEVTSKLNAYLNSVNDYDCVNELSESIDEALAVACEADERLKALMEILYGSD